MCDYSSSYTHLEWDLNNLQNMSLLNSTNGSVLMLDPVLDTYHNHLVTCTRFKAGSVSSIDTFIIIVSGEAVHIQRQYYLFLLLFSAVPDDLIDIVEPDEPVILVAGDNYNITCAVVQHAGLTLDPYITWTDSNGKTLLSSAVEKHNDSFYISRLTFIKIHLSQALGYACRVEQDSPALASPVNYSSDPLVIFIEGMVRREPSISLYCSVV